MCGGVSGHRLVSQATYSWDFITTLIIAVASSCGVPYPLVLSQLSNLVLAPNSEI